MKTPKITAESWRAEIEKVMNGTGPEGISAAELADLLGLTSHTVGERLRKMFQQGTVKCSGRRKIMAKDGIHRSVPVYVIVKGKR